MSSGMVPPVHTGAYRVSWPLLIAYVLAGGTAVLFWTVEDTAGATFHAPISIDGDADFTSANGVVTGSGTPSDPFIIEGWDIGGGTSTWSGIEIRNTQAALLIRDVHVHVGDWSLTPGIVLANVKNAVVQNATLVGNWIGIVVGASVNVSVTANLVARSSLVGIVVDSSENVSVVSNTVNDTWTSLPEGVTYAYSPGGVLISSSTGVSIRGNRIATNNGPGLELASSTGVDVQGNSFFFDGLLLSGTTLSHFNSHNVAPDNLVNNRPLRYLSNGVSLTLEDIVVGQIIVTNGTGVRLTNITVSGTEGGVLLAHVSDANLSGINASSNSLFDLAIVHSNEIVVQDSRLHASYAPAVTVMDSENVTVVRNDVRGPGNFASAPPRILSQTSANVTLTDNSVGMVFGEFIALRSTTGAQVYRNEFSLDGNAHLFDSAGAENAWDGGYPVGGNFWSTYSGPDLCSGPSQDICPGPDGIGDVPYIIDEDSQDRYPRMFPMGPLTSLLVGTPNATPSTIIITSSTPLTFRAVAGDGIAVAYTEFRFWEMSKWGSWTRYSSPFTISAWSPLIEYRSVDSMGVVEETRQTVFGVDDSPPGSQYSFVDPSFGSNPPWIRTLPGVRLTASDSGRGGPGIGRISATGTVDPNVTLRTDRRVYLDLPPAVGETVSEYLSGLNHTAFRMVWPGPASLHFNLWWEAGCADLDLGVFYDVNDDGLPQPRELVGYSTTATTPGVASRDFIFRNSPPGTYLAVVAGRTVTGPEGCLSHLVLWPGYEIRSIAPHPYGIGGTRFRTWSGGSWSGWESYDTHPTHSSQPIKIAGEGLAYLEYFSWDQVNNTEQVRNLTVRLDNIPPESTGKYRTFGDVINVTISFSDAGCGVRLGYYRVDRGPWQNSTATSVEISLSEPGFHTVDFYAIDNLGNREIVKNLTFQGSTFGLPTVDVNWKPIVAALFCVVLIASLLLLVRRVELKRRKRDLILIGLAFVAGEAGTGILSSFTGWLSIPPALGAGTAVDVGLLLGGLLLLGLLERRWQAGRDPALPNL